MVVNFSTMVTSHAGIFKALVRLRKNRVSVPYPTRAGGPVGRDPFLADPGTS